MLYANVVDGVVRAVAEDDDPNLVAPEGWVRIDDLSPEPGPGWSFDGTTWAPPAPPAPPARYAHLEDGVVVNVVETADPVFASTQGWVDIDTVTPQPGIGWTYDGTTWTAPPPNPIIAAQDQAVTTLATLQAAAPDYAGQLQADLQTVQAGWTDLSAADQQAIVTRMLQGFGTLMTAVQAHVVATGVLPPS